MKKLIIILGIIGIFIAAFFVFQEIAFSRAEIADDEIKGYAAAFAMLDKNRDKTEEELLKTAKSYLKNIMFFGSNDMFRKITDHFYGIEEMPMVYHSITELKSGIEESLMILADYDDLMEGKTAPEMEGYTTEDFYRLLSERITAEQNVLDALNSDANPDLFKYALELYREREAHPVIY